MPASKRVLEPTPHPFNGKRQKFQNRSASPARQGKSPPSSDSVANLFKDMDMTMELSKKISGIVAEIIHEHGLRDGDKPGGSHQNLGSKATDLNHDNDEIDEDDDDDDDGDNDGDGNDSSDGRRNDHRVSIFQARSSPFHRRK